MLRFLIKKMLPKAALHKIRLAGKQIANFKILSSAYGQYQSIKQQSCLDREGNPVPWYTYPAIEYLGNLDFSGKTVFEYGCGNSTLWWGELARSVFSVEDSPEWHQRIAGQLRRSNVLYLERDKGSYVAKIKEPGTLYDIIIIDGKHRPECSLIAGRYLHRNGMIVLDNSDWNSESARIIRETYDLIQVDFHGFGPINNYTWTTSIFLSRTSDLKPRGCQPRVSIGGLHV